MSKMEPPMVTPQLLGTAVALAFGTERERMELAGRITEAVNAAWGNDAGKLTVAVSQHTAEETREVGTTGAEEVAEKRR